jgi:hypothetical protein
MANPTTPDWLQQRGGELRFGKDGRSASVYFAGALQYVLVPVPAKGAYACRVSETINGKRIDTGKTYKTLEEAFQGGLADLRAYLGW